MAQYYKNKHISFYWFALIVLIIISPALFLTIIYALSGDLTLTLIGFYRIFTNLLLIVLPLTFFNIRLRTYTFLLSPLAIFIPGIIFHILLFEKTPTRWTFCMLFDIEWMEITEFLKDTYELLLFSLMLPLIILIIAKWRIQERTSLKVKYRKAIGIVFIIALLFTFFAKSIQRKTFYNSVHTVAYTLLDDTFVQTFIRLKKAHKHCGKTIEEKYKLPVISKIDISQKQTIIVLVLGESARYANWNINGYSKQTSPGLDTISNLLSFSNVVTPSFNTIHILPYLLTDKSLLKKPSHTPTTIIDIFKRAGFKTYWIGYNYSKGNSIGDIANRADEWLIPSFSTKSKYDEELLPLFNHAISNKEKDLFIVIQTLGSHYPYQNRYPSDFKKFYPTLTKNKHIIRKERSKQAIINSYDNSIAYTDYILTDVINKLSDSTNSSLLYYVSDHGENLFDYNDNGFGRGYGNLSSNLYHVPLFIWSNSSDIVNSGSWTSLILNEHKASSSLSTIHTIAQLAGISWKDFDSTKSLASAAYKEKERMILIKGRVINYDSINWPD